MSTERLLAFRLRLQEDLPLSRICSHQGVLWRHASDRARSIRGAQTLLSPSDDGPIDVLVQSGTERHASPVIRPCLWSAEPPLGSAAPVADDLSVACPELVLHQLAARASLTQVVLLGSELCGSFSVYSPPPPVREVLQELLDAGRLPRLGGWHPCVAPGGRVGDLWTHEPLATPASIAAFARKSDKARGRSRLLEASRLIAPNAASPFEVQAGVLLGFPRQRGGEGFDCFEHNGRVHLTREASLLAGRDTCICDLLYPEGLDIECQSALFHDDDILNLVPR